MVYEQTARSKQFAATVVMDVDVIEVPPDGRFATLELSIGALVLAPRTSNTTQLP